MKHSLLNTEKKAALAHSPFFAKEDRQHFFGGRDSFFSKPTIQTKLIVNEPTDKYEQEADAMADKVVQRLATPDVLNKKEATVQAKPIASAITPFVQAKCASCGQEDKLQKKEEDLVQESPLELQLKPIFESNAEPPDEENTVQRKCAECEKEDKLQKKEEDFIQESQLSLQRKPIFESNTELQDDENNIQKKCAECEKEDKVQKKSDSPDSSSASSSIESNINSTKGSGSPIPEGTREQMESSFGTDFSNIRLHTDSSAVEMNKDLHAQAFTHGSDIYFNSGKYDINSTGGKHLLAHELTHTVQQGISRNSIQRQERSPLTLSREQIQLEIDWLNTEIDIESVGSSRWSELVDRRTTLMRELSLDIQPPLVLSNALRIAYNEYRRGVIENPSCTNRGAEVDLYTGVTGSLPVISSDRVTSGTCGRPWCAYFVKWCLNQAAVSNGLGPAARSIRTWGEANGWYHNLSGTGSVMPTSGDIFFKTPTEEDSSHPCDINPCVSRGHGTGHVGFILSVSGTTVTTIEGNIHIDEDNDGVHLRTRDISELHGVLRIPE